MTIHIGNIEDNKETAAEKRKKERHEFFIRYLAIVFPLIVTMVPLWLKQQSDKAKDVTRQHTEYLQRIEANRNARRESQKPFLSKQLELYFEAAKVTARLANTTDKAEQKSLKIRFNELYWGELAVVEDDNVKEAMVAYGACLDRKENCPALFRKQYLSEYPPHKYPDRDPSKVHSTTRLKFLALCVAHACRKSLREGFDR
ncbi:MAG TPA: hypothetical protein VGB77_11260 [Abditibacteriaceae bacterium]|jgi:hypothetical protein